MGLLNSLFSGGSTVEAVGTGLIVAGGVVNAADKNDKGPDDLAGGLMVSGGKGLLAWASGDYNKVGKCLDAIISGATALKAELLRTGQIVTVNK